MKFAYDFDRLNNLLTTILRKNLSEDAFKWLESEGESASKNGGSQKFNIAFVAMPRKTGKNVAEISADLKSQVGAVRKGLTLTGWTTDRLARVWLLMQVNSDKQDQYAAAIENLFLSAEMSELVALYSALPVLAYPESWKKRCAEGIRNNIGQVLEAVICDNPYPSENLDELAWNQLVLKAIFTDKPVLKIIGLRERANKNLANSLSDYAHERWAAHREVNPLLWTCVAPFLDEENIADIQRLFASSDELDRKAAALVCHESSFGPAKQLLEEQPELKSDVANGKISWQVIAGQMSKVPH